MSRNGNYYDLITKASMYDLLANYFKYTDPNKHIAYYQKHLHYMGMAVQTMRTNPTSNHHVQGGSGKIRFVHASIDMPNVDIYIDGIRILKNFPYKEASNYFSLPAGKHQVDIYPTGNMVSTFLSRKIIVEHGRSYTLIPSGLVKNLRWLAIVDDPQVPIGQSKFRFVNLSPDAPALDLAIKGREVIFSNISFRKYTNYLALSPMTVDLEARIAGSSNIVLPLPHLQLMPNHAYTILLVGSTASEPGLEIIIIKN
ncbi:DUF4397 domain-containing protein [Cytobacillus depressus]|uniref:DUF4397 domain-containing protein n=1 Tax=Cytobacillus depressus TaxID=1602942 RepID=A0A6L3VBM9_9BACI|nr:DUF4397 domain-containing protein [Cytobacillus depressus]KAB2338177.1 DUF4397 domain-containing protein [Cytobacillus depressus]